MDCSAVAVGGGQSVPLIEATDLVIGYNRVPMLPALNWAVVPGEFWVVEGPNGAGKSTLLRTLLGLQPAVSGFVRRQSAGLRLGYVPQRMAMDSAIPGRVQDVVRSGSGTGWDFVVPWLSPGHRKACERAMDLAGVREWRHVRFSQLSEGQKQRVLLARGFACRPELLVLDEPTASMDARAENSVFEFLAQVVAESSLAVVLVTHHTELAHSRPCRTLLVDKDSGRLEVCDGGCSHGR